MTYKRAIIPKFGLGIDWETTGFSLPNYTAKHQGITFGAVIYDSTSLAVVDQLYREIKFDPKYEWSPGAEKVHGLSREYLAENGVSPEEAATDLANMIVKWIGVENIMLLGHRVHFDKAFTNQLMESVGIHLDYHPTSIDSASMATVLMETSTSEEVFQMLGLPPRAAHNSLEDILHTITSIRKMKEYFLAGIASTMTGD